MFNRSLIFNEVEILGANALQKGNISEKTRLENNPWVNNPEKEMEQMEAEMKLIDPITLDDNDGDGEEE